MAELNINCIIDSHLHLWEKQDGMINGLPVKDLGNGRSSFLGEARQMTPAYMDDGKNTAERLLGNMDYARVNACAVTQEYMDGNQDQYLLKVRKKYPDRFRITSLYEEAPGYRVEGFDGLKICASRLKDKDLKKLLPVFKDIEKRDMYISIDLSDGDAQTEDMKYLIECCPNLRIAIGHFGMVTTKGWQEQIKLAKNENVYIESGGLTWLFNYEYYPFPSAIEAVREAAGICGIEKLMWGSDYPRTMTEITYKMAVRFILETPKLSDEEKRAFLGENARKFFRFGPFERLPEIPNML